MMERLAKRVVALGKRHGCYDLTDTFLGVAAAVFFGIAVIILGITFVALLWASLGALGFLVLILVVGGLAQLLFTFAGHARVSWDADDDE